jgi:hypothetical protein
MGGSSQEKNTQQQSSGVSNVTGQSQLTAGLGTGGILSGLLGQAGGISPNLSGAEGQAINNLTARGLAGNPFAGQIGGVAGGLLGGGQDYSGLVNDAYSRYQGDVGGTANGDYLDPNKNPFFAQTTQGIADQATKALKGIYAGSGRDPGGAGGDFQYNLGNGISTALAPVFSNQYNTERTNQLNAQNNLLNAGGSTAGLLSQLQQSRFGNQQAGIGAAGSAWDAMNSGDQQALAAQAQARGIPLSTLQSLLSSIGGIGAQFGQNNVTQNGFNTSNTNQQSQTNTPFNWTDFGLKLGSALL